MARVRMMMGMVGLGGRGVVGWKRESLTGVEERSDRLSTR